MMQCSKIFPQLKVESCLAGRSVAVAFLAGRKIVISAHRIEGRLFAPADLIFLGSASGCSIERPALQPGYGANRHESFARCALKNAL